MVGKRKRLKLMVKQIKDDLEFKKREKKRELEKQEEKDLIFNAFVSLVK